MPNPRSQSTTVNEALRPYVPRVLIDWVRSGDSSRVREVAGTLAFVDISGFTKLTERLARKGKVGAEELNDLLDAVLHAPPRPRLPRRRRPREVGRRRGPAPVRGCRARRPRLPGSLRDAPRPARRWDGCRAPPGYVSLRMSVGIHSGTFHFFFVGRHHRELVIAGPAATQRSSWNPPRRRARSS